MTTSKSTVITRKDMKEPDRFQQAAGQAANWMSARKQQVRVVAIAAVALIVIVAAILAIQSSRARRAGAEASELLRTVGGQVAATPLPGDAVPTFPTEEAKQRAIVAAADQVLGSTGGGAAALAALAKGDALYKLREWDAARAAYDRYLGLADRDDSLRFGALEGLALVAEGQGKLDDAAQAWARVGQEAPAFADRADLERARVLAQAGKADEARQLLARFGEAHKESPLAGEASERLGRLGGAK
jgi:tetratricopeptide (TPR) repeat protein